jgi:hypothetical protein
MSSSGMTCICIVILGLDQGPTRTVILGLEPLGSNKMNHYSRFPFLAKNDKKTRTKKTGGVNRQFEIKPLRDAGERIQMKLIRFFKYFK